MKTYYSNMSFRNILWRLRLPPRYDDFTIVLVFGHETSTKNRFPLLILQAYTAFILLHTLHAYIAIFGACLYRCRHAFILTHTWHVYAGTYDAYCNCFAAKKMLLFTGRVIYWWDLQLPPCHSLMTGSVDKSYMMTSSDGKQIRVTGPLCAEFTGDRWIPRTKASDAELWCFLWSASE